MTGKPGEALHVLLIEDHAAMRQMVRGALHHCGVGQVTEAANGAEAFEALQGKWDKLPDLIICDLFMANVDGLQFCRKLQKRLRDTDGHVPIVVLTGEEDEMVHDVAYQVGANKVLTKPIPPAVLIEEIGRIIGFSLTEG
jgi:two-component system chemotaxis response regulator CheY